MPPCLPNPRPSIALSRKLAVLCTVAILGAAVPYASARKPAVHKHPRLNVLTHALIDVALPGLGLLPGDENFVPADGKVYELKLAHAHTGEMVDVVYRIGDTYIPAALNQLNQFLCDSHNQEVNEYDPRTFDLLHTMLAKLGKSNGTIDVLSAYRSQETNDALRASGTTNAAEHSQHIVAKAVDLRVDGVPATQLRDAAKSLEAGGVGYYPKSQFVHVDVGPVREWTYSPHHGRAHRAGRSGRSARAGRAHGHARSRRTKHA